MTALDPAIKRPVAVTVICWILIGSGALSLFTAVTALKNPAAQELMAKNPLPIPFQLGMLFLGLLVGIGCGILMLRGRSWARTFFVAWCIFGTVVGLLTSPMKMMMIPGIVLFALEVFFLYRPSANRFFASTRAAYGNAGA